MKPQQHLTNSALHIVRSGDGAIEFRMAPTAEGVFVERVRVRAGSARVAQLTVFVDGKSFQRWCDSDSVRFEYPLVYARLKRDGGALFPPEV